MSILPPSGKTPQRRLSLKGVLMEDVSQGQERTRAWPRSRGKSLHPKTKEQMEWFRQAQWATKYMDPKQMVIFNEMTKGTPLLPRDIATMMMAGRLFSFEMADGRSINAMQTQNDVSQSLDAISQEIGTTLIRKPEGWRGVPPLPANRAGVVLQRAAAFSTVSNAAPIPVVWTTEVLDQASYWNPADPTNITIPITGWYNLGFNIYKNDTSPNISDIFIFINGAEAWRQRMYVDPATAPAINACAMSAYIQAGHKVQFRVFSAFAAGSWTLAKCFVLGNKDV